MICDACKGSGVAPMVQFKTVGLDAERVVKASLPVACRACDGTGYRSNRTDHRNVADDASIESIGKIMQYHPAQGSAQLALDETVHVGSRLVIKDAHGETEFELVSIFVSQMDMKMALRGWLITIDVPRPVDSGTMIYRIGA